MSPPTCRGGPTGHSEATSKINATSRQHDHRQGTAPVRLDGVELPPVADVGPLAVGSVDRAGWAARYAAAGLPVLPLHSVRDGRCSCRTDCGRNIGKHPITRHGVDDATTDPPQITAWWRRWEWANVGVRPPVGLVVIDVDRRTGGLSALADLTRRHGALPPTLSARTGGGGLHIWLRHTGPLRGRLCPGIDLKGCRGYLVMPPSLHASGGRYEWLSRLPIAAAPGWLRLMMGPPPRVAPPPVVSGGRRDDGLVRAVASAPEGRRNDVLNWAAYRAYERGGSPGLLAAIRAAALAVGLAEAEIDRTMGSAARAAGGR